MITPYPNPKPCRACGTPLAWLTTKQNKRPMPVEASTARAGDVFYEPRRHRSHWEHCPAAQRFKQGAPPQPARDDALVEWGETVVSVPPTWTRITLLLPRETRFPLAAQRQEMELEGARWWAVTYTRAELAEAVWIARAIHADATQLQLSAQAELNLLASPDE